VDAGHPNWERGIHSASHVWRTIGPSGMKGTPKNPVPSLEMNNETSETNEIKRPLPCFREISSLSLFLKLNFQE
jgi:hypothetical protein